MCVCVCVCVCVRVCVCVCVCPMSSHTKDSKNGFLIPPCLTLTIINLVSRVKWSNPVKEVAPSPTPLFSSY